MDIVIIYDDAFRNDRHSGSDSAAITEINAVMAHVQTFFNLKVNQEYNFTLNMFYLTNMNP